MNALMKLTWIDFKLFFRSPVVVFFTFAFPVLNMLLFGGMYGNDPQAMFGGRGAADVMVPGYLAALVIGSTAFMNLPLEVATRRQLGVLRRMRASPLHPAAVIGAQVTVSLFSAALSTALLITTGVLAFDAILPANAPALLAAFILSCLSLYALSMFAASLFRSVNAARAAFMAVYFPMMFLSGGSLPKQFLPEVVQTISKFMPLTYTVDLIKGVYLDAHWDLTALAVMGGILLVFGVLGVRYFRWE